MDEFEKQELEKTLALIELLIEETKAGAIRWDEDREEGTIPGDAFHAWIAAKELFVRSRDGDGRQPYVFMILESGNAVHRISSEDSIPQLPSGWEQKLGELYAQARLSGKRSSRAIEDVMAEIEASKKSRAADDIPF